MDDWSGLEQCKYPPDTDTDTDTDTEQRCRSSHLSTKAIGSQAIDIDIAQAACLG